MKLRDWSSGLFWLLMAGYICWEAVKSGIGTVGIPGPGFFPFLSGMVLAALSCILVVSSALRRAEGKMSDPWKGLAWRRVVLVATSLFLYCVLLPILGYLVTTVGLMLLLLVTGKRLKLWIQGVIALVITLASYVIFNTLLGVQLPGAVFSFW